MERPILFSKPMVKAIIEGNKTQTRRIIKPQPDENGIYYMANAPLDWRGEWMPFKWETNEGESIAKHPKHGYPGDKLWVRETFRIVHINHNLKSGGFFTIQYKDFVALNFDRVKEFQFELEDAFYKKRYEIRNGDAYGIWKPSIFMPRYASRITLEITRVDAERLQTISEEDAIKEGVEPCSDELSMDDRCHNYNNPSTARFPLVHVVGFKKLWININGKENWNEQTWVWVYRFKKCGGGF